MAYFPAVLPIIIAVAVMTVTAQHKKENDEEKASIRLQLQLHADELHRIRNDNSFLWEQLQLTQSENKYLRECVERMEWQQKANNDADQNQSMQLQAIDINTQQLFNNVNDLSNAVQTINNLLSQKDTTISFTSYLSSGLLVYNTGANIIFDGLVANYGTGYDPITGIFTCPVSGYYMFFMSLNSYTGDRFIEAEIQMGGVGLATINTDNYDGSSTSVVVYCEQGQQASVRATRDGVSAYGTSDDKMSTFTGTLLSLSVANI